MADFEVVHFDEIQGVKCPCGLARRAFAEVDDSPATLHMVDIHTDSRVHYHKEHTEIYFFLAGTGHMELDGEEVPVRPYHAVLIKPGCRHRAVGRFRIVNVCIPPFDPEDEWFD